MDGSYAAFAFDRPLASRPVRAQAAGILYIEDFDAAAPAPSPAEPAPAPPSPVFSAEELAAAHEAGRAEGAAAALDEAALVQGQLQLAATQALADELAAARATLRAVAEAQASEVAQTVLAMLAAAIPATMRACAGTELQAMLQALAPGLLREPELRVRAHPTQADRARETLIALLPEDTCVLSVRPDATLAEGDLRIAWQDGRAQRDCAALYAAITAALAPLGVPHHEETQCGRG